MDALSRNGRHPVQIRRSPVNAKTSLHALRHIRFQKLKFIVHIFLIVCVITFRVIVDILVWVSSVAPLGIHANRRTSLTTDDAPVAISKTITKFRQSTKVFYTSCIGCSAKDEIVKFMREFALWSA